MNQKGVVVETLRQAREALVAGKIKIPCQVIPSYVLPKDRNNFARTEEEFDRIVKEALDKSPIMQVLIKNL